MQHLRECIDCGLTAETEEDLELFSKDAALQYGRRNLCRGCHSERNNKRYSQTPEYRRDAHYKRTYGITLGNYNALFKKQKGSCKICNSKTEGNLYVDHNHNTGVIRGLLCHKCNVGLGLFNDDTDVMLKAIAYLLRQ